MNELDDFEDRLKRDLRRVDAPEGFADRVMERVPQKSHSRLLTFPSVAMRARHWMAVAAVFLVAIILGFGVHRAEQAERQRELKQEQARAREAAEQFALAMQVTGRTLFVVQQQIDRAGTKSMHGVD